MKSNKISFICVNDPHGRGVNSRFRRGLYYEDWLLKLEEIIALSKTVDFVLCTGDLWDSCDVSINMLIDFYTRIEKAKIPWYIVAGNHDMKMGNLENTSLSLLFKISKYIKHLEVLDYSDTKENFMIVGWDYAIGLEDNIKQVGMIHSNTKNTKMIAVIHSMIVEGKSNPLYTSIGTNEIKTNYDLILSGHNHSNFDVTVGKTRFINTGCIGRLKSNEANIKPSVLKWSNGVAEFIELKSAKNAEDIFDLQVIEEDKQDKIKLNEFIEKLGNVKLQSLSLSDRINEYCKINNIEDDIKDNILQELK